MLDLDLFKKRVARKKKSLTAFLKKLDGIVPEDLPDLVEKIDVKVWDKVSCMDCANCCKSMTPAYTKDDITRISAHFRMKPADFKARWLTLERDTDTWVNATVPCQFLEGNKCTIYAVRPLDCAEFPHHDKKPFDDYNETYRKNIVHCPATLLLIERLKHTVERDYEWE